MSEAITIWTDSLGGDIKEERVSGVLHYFFMRKGHKLGFIKVSQSGTLIWDYPKDLIKALLVRANRLRTEGYDVSSIRDVKEFNNSSNEELNQK